jgi:hypothetical protein
VSGYVHTGVIGQRYFLLLQDEASGQPTASGLPVLEPERRLQDMEFSGVDSLYRCPDTILRQLLA